MTFTRQRGPGQNGSARLVPETMINSTMINSTMINSSMILVQAEDGTVPSSAVPLWIEARLRP
jgi:hypothetical protein